MSETIQRNIFLILGTTIGIVVGAIILSLQSTYPPNYKDIFIVVFTGIIGILINSIILFYKKTKLAKESERVRNETVALITHEMRTALTSTGWAIQFILEHYNTNLKDQDKKMLEDMVESIHTTIMHTVNLLDISLLDIGKLSISLEWVKLIKVEEMIREIIEKYTVGAKKEGISLSVNIKLDHESEVEVDTLRLRIILENLLENSIQYMKNDRKEIKVDISNTRTTLNMVVSDTGIGIPKDEQDKIFGEFYRAINARKKLSSGSGIGLHMCAQYVKAHHGTIRFESKEGEGTTFYISLPLKTIADTKEFLTEI
jgi:signal transduction histidine kinase